MVVAHIVERYAKELRDALLNGQCGIHVTGINVLSFSGAVIPGFEQLYREIVAKALALQYIDSNLSTKFTMIYDHTTTPGFIITCGKDVSTHFIKKGLARQ